MISGSLYFVNIFLVQNRFDYEPDRSYDHIPFLYIVFSLYITRLHQIRVTCEKLRYEARVMTGGGGIDFFIIDVLELNLYPFFLLL